MRMSPHMLAGWSLDSDAATTERVRAATARLDALRRTEVSPALWWCLSRVEGIASSDIEGITTTARSMSRFEALRRGGALSEHGKIDMEALGAVRMGARAVALGRRPDAIVAADLDELHRRLFGPRLRSPLWRRA